MGKLLSAYNERESFGLKSKKTGMIIGTFRLRMAAEVMKLKYEKLYYDEMEIVKI